MSDWQGTDGLFIIKVTEFSEQFRIDFLEFTHSNPEKYTDSSIFFWYQVGEKLLSVKRWGDLRMMGLELYVAHKITLAYNLQQDALSGNRTGRGVRLTSNESVGDVSVAYDNQVGMDENAKDWNLTMYGRQFYSLVRVLGIAAQV